MPEVLLKKLGPFNKKVNPELFCEMCDQCKKEEELTCIALVLPPPSKEAVVMNVCEVCINDCINDSTMNRIKDTFSNESNTRI